ncbi:hypothetical protein [Sciscionella marina]|uniref:hypothetical protein n=1 Tax=Sciscionella marina TaxID=508770 RepID=UPI000367F504|nr:hypothetical protein [Sciscionella marina]
MSAKAKTNPKVTAASLASAVAGFLVLYAGRKLGVELDGWEPVVGAAILGALTLAAGWLKREHIITEGQYESFTDEPADKESEKPKPAEPTPPPGLGVHDTKQ